MKVEFWHATRLYTIPLGLHNVPKEALPDVGDLFTLRKGENIYFQEHMVMQKTFEYDLEAEQMVCRITVEDPAEVHARESAYRALREQDGEA